MTTQTRTTRRNTKPAQQWYMRNQDARRYEAIDLDDCELLDGQTVMLMFYVASHDLYVTIPGESLHVIRNGQPVLERD